MEEKSYTLNQIASRRILINGKPRTYRNLLRVMNDNDVEPVGRGSRDAALYTIEQVENAYNIDVRSVKNDAINDTDGDEITKIKKETLKEELKLLKEKNKIAKQENEKRDLQIKQLKTQLVSYEEALKYLNVRKSIHAALLRRILITDVPTTICGMEMTDARAVCEQYYNEIMQSLIDTSNLWKRKFDASNDTEFERELEMEIYRIVNGKNKEDNQNSK